jgi:predicted RND superfamily exporter protein
MALLPSILVRFPVYHGDDSRLSIRERVRHGADALLVGLAGGIVRFRAPIVLAFAVFMCFFVGGLLRLETAVEPVRFLPEQSRWIADANWYRNHVGPLAGVEMVVGFHEDGPFGMADQLRLVYELQSAVGKLERVEGTLSAASFSPVLGPIPKGAVGAREKVRRHMANRLLEEHRAGLINQHFLAEDGAWERWRVSARVTGFRDLDYTEFLLKLRMAAQPVLDAAGVPREQLQLTYTGAVPLVFAAQRELLDALLLSFLMAVFLVAVVLAAVLKSPAAGMAAMLPNVFPAVAIFGIMGWSGAVVDVGAMMTASIGLGIAVDDTLHMLTWFREAIRDGQTPATAILCSFRRCAPAMTHTTSIAGLGLFVFYFSDFQPVSQFGLLMFVLLVAALIGDLILLPALLVTPLGRSFQPPRETTKLIRPRRVVTGPKFKADSARSRNASRR